MSMLERGSDERARICTIREGTEARERERKKGKKKTTRRSTSSRPPDLQPLHPPHVQHICDGTSILLLRLCSRSSAADGSLLLMLGHDEFSFLVAMGCPANEGEGGGTDGVDVLAEWFISSRSERGEGISGTKKKERRRGMNATTHS